MTIEWFRQFKNYLKIIFLTKNVSGNIKLVKRYLLLNLYNKIKRNCSMN